jgi:hypothetical protein
LALSSSSLKYDRNRAGSVLAVRVAHTKLDRLI